MGRIAAVLRRMRCTAPGVVADAFREFIRQRSLETGAGIAYFAFFSLFPLAVFLFSILSYVLDEKTIITEVMRILDRAFPAGQNQFVRLVDENLGILFRGRGSLSIIAIVGLFWAGSNVFAVLVRYINLAWGARAVPLTFIRKRLFAFAGIVSLALTIVASFLLNTAVDIVSQFDLPFRHGEKLAGTAGWTYFTDAVPYIFGFLLLSVIYYWVPKTQVRLREACGGALAAIVALRLAYAGFKWSIVAGVLNYRVVYGSLATVVLSLFWIYICSLVILFGAHLGAAMSRCPVGPAGSERNF
ncbi:MAG: YihY/virulence factor BrkB family protein [Candidatus Krumholzibacteriota bacterium]|nr:YihY/virulence factor BrkB family protein [Candidatus Krumholzibacteriota bacterium]